MSSNRKSSRERVKEYLLEHPEESKIQQATALGVSVRTIGHARADLIREGKITPTRKSYAPRATLASVPRDTPKSKKPANLKTLSKQAPRKTEPELLDHEAMATLAAMMEEIDSLDDEEVARRLQRQCLTFAMNPRLHPDTRMSASQMWTKLKSQTKAQDLGPGNPLTFDDAVDRLGTLMVACGIDMVLAAINKYFDTAPTEIAHATSTQTESREAPPGTSSSPLSADHPSPEQEAQDVRPLVVAPPSGDESPGGHPDPDRSSP